jgi:hypothetical protein
MADDGDFLAAFDRACQRERAHHGTGGIGDNIAGSAEPNELIFRNAEDRRQQPIEARVYARQCDEREFVSKISGMHPGVLIASQRAMIRIYNGFEQAHGAEGVK